MPKKDTKVVCSKCGRVAWVNFKESLKNGWEMCCGMTMLMENTSADIDRAVKEIVRDSDVVMSVTVAEGVTLTKVEKVG